jgi:malate synthase
VTIITITEQDLVEIPKGTVTEDGIRKTSMLVFYMEAWLEVMALWLFII